MMGYQAPYIPGWDTHGLPIERQAIKAYGMDRSKVSTAEFRSKCEEFAHDHVNTQRTQFKRLGVIGDWDRPYLTLTHDYEAAQIEIFGEMAKKGYIYKGQEARFTGARTTRPHWLRQRLSTRMFRVSLSL